MDSGECADCKPRGKFLPPPEYGPWFAASYYSDCDGCGGRIEPGERIRSDGDGGWLCLLCGDRGGGTVDVTTTGNYL